MAEKTNPVPMGAQAPKSRFFTPYVLIWAVLASGSLLYLALLATQPALVASFLGAGPTTQQTAHESEERRAMTEAVAEVRLLRETVDRFRDDLQELKAEVSNQNERGGDITSRISVLETAAAAAAADPQKIAADKRAAAKAAKAAAATPEAAAPAQQPAAKAAAAKKAEASLETGSVAGPPVSFGPAIVTPATKVVVKTPTAIPSKTFGVQIASGPSVDSLRLSWTLLAERHGDSLRSLQPRYTVGSDGTGATYDLVVGPLNSAADATRLCQELSVQATPCSIGIYSGDVL
jgi:hypothetical protein